MYLKSTHYDTVYKLNTIIFRGNRLDLGDIVFTLNCFKHFFGKLVYNFFQRNARKGWGRLKHPPIVMAPSICFQQLNK